MPTTFIAVQCFQCCTMQVKQQKKSSNKWSCVVCNQNQSVRKVFGQSSMARDVRQFVQNFNMSRQLADQKQSLSEEIETFDSQSDSRKAKRHDWSEYVVNEDEYGGKLDIPEVDNGLEPMVVTEVPKALFKKPKAKDYSSNRYGSGERFKPIFPERRNAKRPRKEISQDIHLTESQKIHCGKSFKKSDYSNETSYQQSNDAPTWSHFSKQIQDSRRNSEKPFVRQPTKGVTGLSISQWSDHITQEDGSNNAIEAPMVQSRHTTAVSKWSSFIIEEDENVPIGNGIDSVDRVSQQRCHPLEKLMNDERIEDDIHPDFLRANSFQL